MLAKVVRLPPAPAMAEHIKVADIRMSPLNIQMISKSLHEQVFWEEQPISDDKIRLCQQHLESHGFGSNPHSHLHSGYETHSHLGYHCEAHSPLHVSYRLGGSLTFT